MLPAFAYARPTTLQQALDLVSQDKARVHAGGTDLVGCLRDGIFDAATVVSLSRIDELRGLAPTPEGGLHIGALTTIAELAAHPIVKERYRALAQAAAAVASPQLRNQGTLGGNLCQKPRCWYYRGEFHCIRKGGDTCYAYEGENEIHCLFGGNMCYVVHPSDTAPALIALGATARIVGVAGTRLVPLEKFFVPAGDDPTRETVLGPAEILAGVTLPPLAEGVRSSYRKIRARASWDFALVSLALAVRVQDGVVRDARVVLGGVAPTPWRAPAVEAILANARLDAATIARAAEAAVQGAEPLAQNAYKVSMLRGVVAAELEAIGRG
jgi:xanthine dehydrogenase YagS FAD-binding subunit